MSKRKKKSGKGKRQAENPLTGLVRGIRPYSGWIITAAVVGVVAVGAWLLVGSGDSDGGSSAEVTVTPDARVGAATPAASLPIAADDEGQQVNPRFEPNELNGPAGQVVALVLQNNGTVVHNLRVSGVDRAYETADDWMTTGVKPGEQDELRVKIDPVGSYPFRCDFHPQQTGTLVLR
jgi:uncharacterized cupredoxin-like copper-binding protein